MITLVGIIIFLVLLLLSSGSVAQDSCSYRTPSTVVLNPNRKMDSAFQISSDRWSFVSYQIEQDDYSEVHLKYLSKNEWVELAVNKKKGIVILSGCIPPRSWVLIEHLSLDRAPRIIKQIENIY